MSNQGPPSSPTLPFPGRFLVLTLALTLTLAFVTLSAMAQTQPRLTFWRAADGLPQSSTIGVALHPQGHLVSSHGPGHPLARFDGYHIQVISNSIGPATRVVIGPEERLWSSDNQGLLLFAPDGWTSHPLPEIAAEMRTNPRRPLRPIPLLPHRPHGILILLPDRLLDYDAPSRRVRTVLVATNTALERFHELSRTLSGGAWITGARGLLHLPGPLTDLSAPPVLEEFLLPAHLAPYELQRAHESRSGEVVMAAENPLTRDRLIVRWNLEAWMATPIAGHAIRQAWSGPDGELWAHTAGSLIRLEPDDAGHLRPRIVTQVARIADVLLEPHGATWLATSEGMLRIAPLPWRLTPDFPSSAESVTTLFADRRGQLTAVTPHHVHQRSADGWRTLPLPGDTLEEESPLGPRVFPLPDGALIAHRQGITALIPTHQGHPPLDPSLSTAIPLGTLPDGRVILHLPNQHPPSLVGFDGQSTTPLAILPEALPAEEPLRLALLTRTGELWVGSESHLFVRRGDQWMEMTHDAAPADGALAALELTDGRLWFGGRSTLLETDGRQWKLLRRGLDRVHALHLGRDGAVWVASGSGLLRYFDHSWLVLGEEEGLPDSAIHAAYEDGAGRWWAAASRGLFSLDPLADRDRPLAEIVEADLPKQTGNQRAIFILGGRDRWNFTPPGRLQFSWRLDNNPWSSWRSASAVQFTNLTAATHRFSVRALDPTGNVQVEPTVREFTVTLPWFKDPRLVGTSVALALVLLAMTLQAVLNYSRLKRSYAEVERQVAERSAALEKANAELLHSQKMRALGTLAAGVAHDFNNLLSIIKGSTQLVEAHLDDPGRSRPRLQRIKTAVDQGAALVRAMLGFSRGASPARRTLTPETTLQQALSLLDERLQARVHFHPPPSPLPAIVAPPEMLQQILVNLIQNADEAMNHEGLVHVELQSLDTPPDALLPPAPAPTYVAYAIRDQGSGIPPENLSRIFEPFFTTKSFSSRRGTGLGLSMVYEFAKEMGAGISIQSTLGQGSTFHVLIPVTPGPPIPAAPGATISAQSIR